MPAFVKTKKDEELWANARARAKEQGRDEEWAYVTGIYKSMKGGKVAMKWNEKTPEQRAAKKKAFAPMVAPRPPADAEEIVVLPADVKRMSAERMRELGRSLMVAGMRAPRQQMISIAVTLDGLLEQLNMLGEQDPGLGALKRRILLGLRGKVLR